MLKLGEVGSTIQQMVNAAGKVLKAAGKAGITPTERKARTAMKRPSKKKAVETAAEDDE